MSVCGACGAAFSCGMTETGADQTCWCAALPALPAAAIDPATCCLCPACLRQRIDALAAESTRDAPQATSGAHSRTS